TFAGEVTLLNVWASWCVPCHDEAPLLAELAQDKRIRLAGINYKDEPDNARRFLNRYGNPFVASGADGRIAYKLVGPITAGNLNAVLKPEIEKALAKAQ